MQTELIFGSLANLTFSLFNLCMAPLNWELSTSNAIEMQHINCLQFLQNTTTKIGGPYKNLDQAIF